VRSCVATRAPDDLLPLLLASLYCWLFCQVTGVPVVDGEKHLVGVVSKKDLEKPGVRSNLILFISA